MFDNNLQKVFLLWQTDITDPEEPRIFIGCYKNRETAEKEADRRNENEESLDTVWRFLITVEVLRI